MANLHGISNCPIMGTERCFLEEIGKCPVEETSNLIGKRWTILILRELFGGKKRFNELLKSLDITPKVLSDRLKEMEKLGIINRKAYAEVPSRVEYSLTEKGAGLKDSMVSITEWWTKWNGI